MPDDRALTGKCVIFDLDGTLVDSVDDITTSLNHVMSSIGIPPYGRKQVAIMVGDGVTKLMSRAARSDNVDLLENLLSKFMAHYRDNCLRQTHLYKHIPEQLDILQAQGWNMAVLSNKPDELTKKCCKNLLSRWKFSHVQGARVGIPKKPTPEAATKIASSWGVKPEHVVVVGDGTVDVQLAKAAGMASAAVTWGYRDAEQLLQCQPDLVIHDPAALTASLNKLHI